MRPRGTPPHEVKFYFSYRSPYAWLATRRMESMLTGLPVELLLRPVWEPEPELEKRLAEIEISWHFAQPSREKRRYIFQDIRRYVRAGGLRFKWPIDRDSRWTLAHLGHLFAREHGRERAYHRTLFDLRFERGENILDPERVGEVLRSLGLDSGDFLQRVEADRFWDEIVRCFEEAEADGVCGWPFFVYGRQRFWGNDRLEWLAEAVRADHPVQPEGSSLELARTADGAANV